MNWHPGTSFVTKAAYTALEHGGHELARYDHLADGTFRPATRMNNARPRATERDARLFILKQMKAEIAALIRAEKACSTGNPVEQPAPTFDGETNNKPNT